MKFTPYLVFNGTCREAFEFYHRVLGGELEAMMPFGESPGCEEMPPDAKNLIMHACLRVDGEMLMASDNPPSMPAETIQGSHVSIHVDRPEEAERIYKALSEGGKITMELQETFWAVRFAMFNDRFGVPWMINCSRPEGDCPPA